MHRELADLYARLGRRVAASSPRCEMSGRCCDFPRSDHELFATEVEEQYALAAAGGAVPAAASGQCPWYVDGLCGLRDGRPLGCRVYFCDPGWSTEMPEVYESFHAELRALHTRFERPYVYRRFVDGMAARRTATRPAAGESRS